MVRGNCRQKEENKVKKYAMALSFNVHQLKMLSEKYPDLGLMELESLFEKPAQNNKAGYKNNNSKTNYPQKKSTETTATPKVAQTTPQRAAAPAQSPVAQQRPASEKSPSPAEFIQQKLDKEKQQQKAPQETPQKPLTEKDDFIRSCKAAYQEAIASGKIKETQNVTRKPIKP